MDSPFELALASIADSLPPPFRAEFLVGPESPYRVTLVGSMHIWRRHRWLAPLYWVLARAGVMVGRSGTGISTTLTVEPGRGSHGAPYHFHRRVFGFASPVCLDTLTTYDFGRKCLVDHIGPRRSLLLLWNLGFTPPSEVTLVRLGFALALGSHSLVLPRWFSSLVIGTPRFSQRALLDPPDTVHVDFAIRHPLLGDLFGYCGNFRVVCISRS